MATTVPASPGRNGIRVHSGYRQRPRSTGIIDARSATPDKSEMYTAGLRYLRYSFGVGTEDIILIDVPWFGHYNLPKQRGTTLIFYFIRPKH